MKLFEIEGEVDLARAHLELSIRALKGWGPEADQIPGGIRNLLQKADLRQQAHSSR